MDLEEVIVLGVSPLVISEIAVLFEIDLRERHERISRLGCQSFCLTRPRDPVAAIGVSMNPDGVQTWQLVVHRKLLNLQRFATRIRGGISPMVKYWTVEQERSAWINRLKPSCEPR